MIGKMLGTYQSYNRPGKGGMGEAFQAKDWKPGRCAAMKFLPLLVAILLSPVTTAASSCESLTGISLTDATITSAQIVAPGDFIPPQGVPGAIPAASDAGQAFKTLPAFCRVAVTIKPTNDSDIKIEVWMPMSGWNHKFLAVGNGGWAGSISYAAMSDALRRGYSTSSTDTGHVGTSGSFVLEHPEKYTDFAWRSVHEMTLKAKAIIRAFSGEGPRLSYWNGCSTGGRQGLIEAQRFPTDYDGIIAGASANPRTRQAGWQLYLAQAVLRDTASFIPPAKHPAIHKAVLDACDRVDGVKDGVIEDPTRCRFNPQVLACKGEEGPECLTNAQVEAVRKIMSPATRGDGTEIFPGLEPGAELGWSVLLGRRDPLALSLDCYRYVVFKDPNWDWRTFDLERDVALAEKVDNGTIDAVNPDLKAFVEHGGKLLMYHGWADQMGPPRASINYYKSVLDKMGGPAKTASWIRLFMVPGMAHCGGGEGANSFDMVDALDQWVEQGKAPDQILASRSTGGKVDRTRPLCPYPKTARYKGSGSTDDAANFECSPPGR